MKSKRQAISLLVSMFIMLSFILSACGGRADNSEQSEANEAAKPKIGIAWRADTDSEFYTNICCAIEEAGGIPVLLNQVIAYDLKYDNGMIASEGVNEYDYLEEAYAEIVKSNTYHNSNTAEVISEVDAVIFTGGEDISPTLLREPEDWHGITEELDYNASRDVSDYLLMSYCIDNDIPTMGFCRGMQMLAVVSGGSIIQDIPVFFEENNLSYNYEHRNNKTSPEAYRDYAPHAVAITDKASIISSIFESDTVSAVPSWHHQAVKSVEGTELRVTAVTETNGYSIIECIERSDKTMIIGFQFHPEAAVVKHKNGIANAESFMDSETALKPFIYFLDAVEALKVDKAA